MCVLRVRSYNWLELKPLVSLGFTGWASDLRRSVNVLSKSDPPCLTLHVCTTVYPFMFLRVPSTVQPANPIVPVQVPGGIT